MNVSPLHPDVLDLLEVARAIASPDCEVRVRRHCRLCESCAEELTVMIDLREGMGLPAPAGGPPSTLAVVNGTH